MNRPSRDAGPLAPILLDYSLTEADVHHYRASGRGRACRCYCQTQKWSILLLVALGSTLVGLCSMAHGFRSGATTVGITLALLLMFIGLRELRVDRRLCRLARDLGVPCQVHLAVSSDGIVKQPGPEPEDPGRRFAWRDIVEVSRADGLTVIRLRPAGGVLLIPDQAFPDAEARDAFPRDAEVFRSIAALASNRSL